MPNFNAKSEAGAKVKYPTKSGLSLHFFLLPFVSLDIVSLDILEVVSEVILQSGHHAAVFVHQLRGARLRGEPVHHRRQLLLLNLLQTNTSCQEDELRSLHFRGVADT